MCAHQSPSSVPSDIYIMGAEQTSRTGKDKKQKPLSREDKIFERAMKRLKTTPDIMEEDRHYILRFVEHLLAKGVGKSRVVKYINHLTVVARIAVKIVGKPIGQFNRTGIGKVVSRINTRNQSIQNTTCIFLFLFKFSESFCSKQES